VTVHDLVGRERGEDGGDEVRVEVVALLLLDLGLPDRSGMIWPTSESPVTSSSRLRWAEVKVSARIEAVSERRPATGSRLES